MTIKSDLGRLGENIACEYLIKRGYKIIERNFRKPWGEIDIIAKAPDKTLIFVEVKTMVASENGLRPEDQATKSKLSKVKKTASLYAGHYPEKVDDKKGWRIDLVAITLRRGSGQDKEPEIKHYENI